MPRQYVKQTPQLKQEKLLARIEKLKATIRKKEAHIATLEAVYRERQNEIDIAMSGVAQ